MPGLNQETLRELPATLRRMSLDDSQEMERWLSASTIGKLVEFYTAQWGHLDAFNDENRWLRSLPPLPYGERVAELHSLYKGLLVTEPPPSLAHSLAEVLHRTEDLAVACETCRKVDLPPVASLLEATREHQEVLGDTRDGLLAVEAQIVGPVPPLSDGLSLSRV